MDAYSKEVLEGNNIEVARSVASISKIMTAIIALESDKLFEVVTIGDEIKDTVGSAIYLNVGERITILDLVYGLLLRSGNDCASSIAVNVSGGIDRFVESMNLKAKELNMVNTTFSNPSGLDIVDNGNISTCFDMAILMSYCLENELFCEIIHTQRYKSLDRVFINKNKLLKSYDYLIGGKTGYTYKAKRTLINAAEKDNQKIIVVTFDCGSDFSFHKQMFEKYFNNYSYLLLLKKGDNYINEYVINVKNNIGIRLLKNKVESGLIIYRINESNMTLRIEIYDKNNNYYSFGEYEIMLYKCLK